MNAVGKAAWWIMPLLVVASASASAALMRITPDGVASTDQGAVSPVPIDGDGDFRLTYHSNGNRPDIVNPLIVIIATPDGEIADPASTSPSLSAFTPEQGTVSAESISGGQYVGLWDNNATYSNVYDFVSGQSSDYDLNPHPAGPSENYSNWTTRVTDLTGLTITGWDIFVFEIVFDPELGTGDWYEFDTSLAKGTYIVGWGCTSPGDWTPDSTCDSSKATPFTFSGLVVPEPSTISLLGVGLLGMGLLRRRGRA